MAATTHPRAEPAPATRLPRFDRVERALHWANATLFTGDNPPTYDELVTRAAQQRVRLVELPAEEAVRR